MTKDEKYIHLVRRLHWAEQNFLAHIPIEKMKWKFDESVAWEQLENLHLNPGLTKLQQIELKRLSNIRMDIYVEINELLGNEEFVKFVKEYMAFDKDTLEPRNPIGSSTVLFIKKSRLCFLFIFCEPRQRKKISNIAEAIFRVKSCNLKSI